MSSLKWAPFWNQDPDSCMAAIDRWLLSTNDTANWNCTYLTPPKSWSCPWDSTSAVQGRAALDTAIHP